MKGCLHTRLEPHLRLQLPGKAQKCLTSSDAMGDFPFFFKKKKNRKDPVEKKKNDDLRGRQQAVLSGRRQLRISFV